MCPFVCPSGPIRLLQSVNEVHLLVLQWVAGEISTLFFWSASPHSDSSCATSD